METIQEAVLTSHDGAAVPLKGVAIVARLFDLLAVVEVTQTFRNEGDTSIEAVYTFPLPLDATLLELELTVGERRMRGQVVEKIEAEVRYEQAIESGHNALMLEKIGDGLYVLNLGHLQAGEDAIVRFRYGLIGQWNGDEYRFRLPTTLAPRYGHPASTGLKLHQKPRHSLTVDYPLTLRVEAFGRLRDARIQSPSHPMVVKIAPDRAMVSLAGEATLDRDLVLSFVVAGDIAAFAYYAPDGERFSTWASFHPTFSSHNKEVAARSLRLVIDCSGSMAGTSNMQAKVALLEILDRLIPEDRFNLIAFGSRHKALFNCEVAATPVNLAIARNWVRQLKADMGGTELAAAVEAACEQPAQLTERDLLLVTDGEVWDDGRIAEAASNKNWRVFAVGVGSAPAEAVLCSIAEATGGAVEMVAPGEEMGRRIVRHFDRLRERHVIGRVVWPVATEWSLRGDAFRCFAGDTVHAFATMAIAPEDTVRLVSSDNDRELVFAADVTSAPTEMIADLPRLVASRWLADARPQHATAIALRYQLVSEYTNYLVVMERADDEVADGLPELRVVPQMLAAGWGGTGGNFCSSDQPPHLFLTQPSQNYFESRVIDYQAGGRLVWDEDEKPKGQRLFVLAAIDFMTVMGAMLDVANNDSDMNRIDVTLLREKASASLRVAIDELVQENHDERWLWVIVAWLLASTTPSGINIDPGVRERLCRAVAIVPWPAIALARVIERLMAATGNIPGGWNSVSTNAAGRSRLDAPQAARPLP